MVYHFNGIILYSFIFLYLIIIAVLKYKFRKNMIYLFCFTIMYVYLCYVIKLTQFPIYIDDFQRESLGGQNVWRDMNLIPFKNGFSMTSLLNIIMTIPLGFGLPFLLKANLKRIFIIGVISSLLFECGQLITALYAGYTFRVVDINDLLFNILGTIIGYLIIFNLFKAVYTRIINKMNIENDIFDKSW